MANRTDFYVAQYSPEPILNDNGDAPRHQAVPVLRTGPTRRLARL
jgi:hypothetical protein